MAKSQKGKKIEWIVLVTFIICYCIISAYHEPWFDEIQSWEIAKCDSFLKMLFTTTHYEGNPALWYLILAIPAKLGMPVELGLKTVGLLISSASVFLVLFKSPFPKPIKYVLPFSYFFFYQYGIVVRPYCLMILAFLTVACCFARKNIHPWRFVFALAFLCATSSFCVMISGGIAICWLFEICRNKQWSYRELIKDSRVYPLFVLFIFACIVVMSIVPAEDASFIDSLSKNNSLLVAAFVTIFTLLPETLIWTSPWFANDRTPLISANLEVSMLIPAIIIELIIVAFVIIYSSRKNLKYFVFPYLLYSVFGAVVFLSGHHLGIGLFLLIFWLWINTEDGNRFEIGRILAEKTKISEKDIQLLQQISVLLLIIVVVVNIYWTGSSAIKEIQLDYSYGRSLSSFIKENGLDKRSIAMAWSEGVTDPTRLDFYEEMDTSMNWIPVSLAAYFGKNIVYNFNDGSDLLGYVIHRKTTGDENRRRIENWKNRGVPEILLGPVDVELLTDNSVTINDYVPVSEIVANYIWKGNDRREGTFLLIRKDMLDEYGLKPIVLPDGVINNKGFVITDEMKKQYMNGESIEEILDPALDFMFGEP